MLKPGVELLAEEVGSGSPVQRHRVYRFRIRMWLSRGDPIVWEHPWRLTENACIEEDGTVLVTDLRVDREFMFAGLFYGVQGMHVGGTRRLRIAPHLGYGESGIPGTIPPNALLTVEATVIAARTDAV